jgi:hypothetical protein
VTGFWERVTIAGRPEELCLTVLVSAQPQPASALPGSAPACLLDSGLQVDPRVMKGNSLLTTSTSALQSRLTRCELRRYREKRPHLQRDECDSAPDRFSRLRTKVLLAIAVTHVLAPTLDAR